MSHDAYDARDRAWCKGETYVLNPYDSRSRLIWGVHCSIG
jgi:hypothetical protein